jgi:very-short-patch-repair endonuclease
MCDMRTFPDNDLAALAATQHGVVSREQLRRCGFGDRMIVDRVAAGRLHRIHRCVYAVGHTALRREGRLMAAALACGPGAVLSHATAASVWDLRPTSAARIDVTIPSAKGRQGPAVVRLRRRPGLNATDVTRRNGLPVTNLHRTLLDLAATIRASALDRALEQAEKLQLLDVTPIAELLERERGRPGAPALAKAIRQYAPEPTRSDLEADFLALCESRGLPRPSVNTWIEGYEVDAHWPGTLLVAELDSRRHHHTTAAFERDRLRDAALAAAGYTVMRFTARRILWDAAGVARDARKALSARSPAGTAPRS